MTEVNSTQGNYFGRISDTQYLRRSKKKRCRPQTKYKAHKEAFNEPLAYFLV
jgi:hypothetical protein